MVKFFYHYPPPPLNTAIPDKHDFIFIKEVDTTNGVLYLGGGGDLWFYDLWYLGKGEGVKVTKYLFLTLTYLRSVLIFIKQYSDSMCFCSIFSWK